MITKFGYPALPDTLEYKSVKGTDRANEQAESWLYFFLYDTYLYVDFDGVDREAAEAYVNAYIDTLEKENYHPVYEGGAEEPSYYESENGISTFRYQFDENGVLNTLFKADQYISAKQAEAMIAEAGYPKITLREPLGARDLVQYWKAQHDVDLEIYLALSQQFDTVEEADKFLSDYEALLLDEGFGRVNPDNVGSLKQIAIYNDEMDMLVGVDFFELDDGGAEIYFDFKAAQ